MHYRHTIRDCFAEHIGERGLSADEYQGAMTRAKDAHVWLSERYRARDLALLHLPEQHGDLDRLRPIAETFRKRFSDVVVLGTGGSSLGGQTLYALADSGFGPTRGGPKIHFIDNVDPYTFESLFDLMDLERTGFIVISKSGGTAETVAQFISCLDRFMMQCGRDRAAEHALVITEPGGNPLRSLANRLNLPVLDHDPEIGGRFSVLSVVGILPAMIAGLDPLAIRRGAGDVLRQTLDASDMNAAAPVVGAALKVGFIENRHVASSVLMPYVDRLSHFGLWFQQLWAESLGKEGTGTTPVRAMGTRDQHSQMQLYLDGPKDKMFTLVTLDVAGEGRLISTALVKEDALGYLNRRRMGDLLEAEQHATAVTLARNGCPTRLIQLAQLNETTLGALLMHFMLETILVAHMLGINAFDQPAVEEGKQLARRFLGEMS
ncbi:glucose-6-phosphate isomerase [Varunaivibrio sulfuroxidans]|uniref:Glucose-6-phosphate isomerase n=1 Tax=Varunaivibrio sulfuroxidans TaxID=1773489 RepID=A0A4R3J445_9PROT|nr:glucose-6-phosphate isomerase [Varunaivibrio sulfuroxidans]TCS60619.1 glucose-6-phosphate isomerase [Varunaivibrio sulfuroxidans]WES30108.1 glucose-6-phosphate isomerase [Varunaivibrio sulfuroxidans]